MEENSTLMIVLGVCIVLGVSCMIFLFSEKINSIPYTVLLLITGIIFALFNPEPIEAIKLNPESVFLIFLPILLFESAFNFDFREFKRIITPGFLLATIGLVISSVIIAIPLTYIFQIPFAAAFMFGSVISSTDPIAVLSLFKQLGVPKKLQLLVDGESFLNDATSVIMYRITLGFATGAVGAVGSSEIIDGISSFLYLFLGGLIVGAVFGYVFSEIIFRIKNVSSVEITLTILLAHLVFITSEDLFGVSGIVAVLSAGLMLGNYGRTKISPEVTHSMHQIWDILVFMTTSIVFFLIGYEIHPQNILQKWQIITITIIAVLIARSISVYSVLSFYNTITKKVSRIPLSWMHITNWGGLRGSLPLIVLLSLPIEFAYRDLFIEIVIGVVFFTLVVNAITIKPLIKYLGLDKINQTNEIEVKITELLILSNLKKKICSLVDLHEIGQEVCTQRLIYIDKQLEKIKKELSSLIVNNPTQYKTEIDKVLRRYCLQVEKGVYYSLFKKGIIPEVVYGALKNTIEVQIEGLNEGLTQINDDLQNKNKIGSNSLKLNWFDKFTVFLNQDIDMDQKIVIYNYKYHKSRLLGDEKVISELQEFMNLDFLPPNVVKGIELFYKELEAYNTRTLEEIEKQNPETTRNVEIKFAELECKYFAKNILHELGEEERISTKSLQWLNSRV